MPENQRGETIAGIAVFCGMVAGFVGLVVAVFSFFAGNFAGAGVCLVAAGLSFGLVANATLRR
ncbi:MAG TPA: hypothetical protein VEX86_19675 [Longimicrobium sp.]|nr:hypothetical protein [Longimicrobium sp.]